MGVLSHVSGRRVGPHGLTLTLRFRIHNTQLSQILCTKKADHFRDLLFSKTGNAHFVNLLVRSSGRFALLNRISFSTSTRISLRCPVLHALLRKAKRASYFHSLLFCKTGNVLFSQAVARQVSSALESLTSVFEMGTGGSSPPLSPDFLAPLFHDILYQLFLLRLS